MTWDYIIVGAGSAGCALARELISSGRSVLIIEAGSSDRSPLIKWPVGALRAQALYDWGYRSEPDPSRNGASENWKRGRVLGGSSSVNGMIYVRGATEDFDRWSELCGYAGGWASKDVVPIFRELESSDQNGRWRGRVGPLHVTTVRHPHTVTQAFVRSTCAAGVPFNEDYNGNSQDGVSYVQRTLRNGLRWSAADAFLKPLLGKPNVKLILNAVVDRMEFRDGRAVGLSFLHKGRKHCEAAHDIILCAGAINSPKLLMLSGIGDAEELRRHKIDITVDLPGVGRNLKEHPLLRLVYRSKVPTYNQTEGLLQKLGVVFKFLRHREGPLTVAVESTAFLRTSSAEALPDIQIYFAPIGGLGKIGKVRELAPFPSFMMLIAKNRPISSGRIALASGDSGDPPLIECRLLSQQADIDTLIRGIDTVRRIAGTDPLASIIDAEIKPGPAVRSEEALREFVRSNTEVAFHPNGTCRMGLDAEAVVGPDLRVRGIDNLWIADASIMPDHISANLNAVCIMIGAKLGKQLLARR